MVFVLKGFCALIDSQYRNANGEPSFYFLTGR